jgi:hypothetical protein
VKASFFGSAIDTSMLQGGHDTRDKKLTQHQFPVSASAVTCQCRQSQALAGGSDDGTSRYRVAHSVSKEPGGY